MDISGLKFSCEDSHFSAIFHKIIKVTINSKCLINAKSYKYIGCLYVCNGQAIKDLSSPLYLRQIVKFIRKMSHKIGLNLNRLDRGLQRFLLPFSPFCDELKYTPDRDFFPFFFFQNKKILAF